MMSVCSLLLFRTCFRFEKDDELHCCPLSQLKDDDEQCNYLSSLFLTWKRIIMMTSGSALCCHYLASILELEEDDELCSLFLFTIAKTIKKEQEDDDE